VVALSGGADSTLALHVLNWYSRQIELAAVYADRGDAYASTLRKFAQKVAKRYDVPFYVVKYSELGLSWSDVRTIAQKVGGNMCSVCGVIRRRLINDFAKKNKFDKVATGHNLTDEAQSYLMNFIRGYLEGFRHLGPISPKAKGLVQRIKPIRPIPEGEVRLYCSLKKIEYHPKPCPCRLGSLRYNTQRVLREIVQFRPSAEFSIVALGDKIAQYARAQFKQGAKGVCVQCGEPASGKLCQICKMLKLRKV